MTNTAAVQLIAQRLPKGLVHPGDGDKQPAKLIPLPGLGGTGIPSEQAAHFAAEAGMPANDTPKLIAEAIVHLIETELDGGSEIIARSELDTLREAVAAPAEVSPAAPSVDICCEHGVLVSVASGRSKAAVDCGLLRHRLAEVCN